MLIGLLERNDRFGYTIDAKAALRITGRKESCSTHWRVRRLRADTGPVRVAGTLSGAHLRSSFATKAIRWHDAPLRLLEPRMKAQARPLFWAVEWPSSTGPQPCRTQTTSANWTAFAESLKPFQRRPVSGVVDLRSSNEVNRPNSARRGRLDELSWHALVVDGGDERIGCGGKTRYSPKCFNAIWMPSSYIFWKLP